jgi:hypothetical protein
MQSTTPPQLKRFLLEIAKLSESSKYCLAQFLNEIDQTDVRHIGKCPWRAHHDQFSEALPAINVLCSSAQIEKYETPIHSVFWTPYEFYMPYSPELYLLWGELAKRNGK